jgi:glycerol-3-phosphate acyltransferase PlsY
MLELAVKSLIAYLVGSLMGALLLGACKGVDIRELGSGNAGGTNALRTQGKLFAAGVVVIDVAKGWLAAAWLPPAALPGVQADPALAREWLALACATAVVVGHVYPVWFEFRGGKGAATLIGVLLAAAPRTVAPALGVWLVVALATGFVGLSTMCAAAAVPFLLAWHRPLDPPLFGFAVGMALFVVYTHRANIARMRAGTESRARRLWLLGPRTAAR